MTKAERCARAMGWHLCSNWGVYTKAPYLTTDETPPYEKSYREVFPDVVANEDFDCEHNIADAMVLVEYATDKHSLDFSLEKAWNTGWLAVFTNEPTSCDRAQTGEGRADTAPAAITDAFLNAMEAEIGLA